MLPFLQMNLSHTPGIVYAVSYWLSTMLIIFFLPKKYNTSVTAALSGIFLASISATMSVTDYTRGVLFFLYLAIEVGMIIAMFYYSCDIDLLTALYYSIRAFLLGEFATSFAWQLYFYFVNQRILVFSWSTILPVIGGAFAVIFFLAFELERWMDKVRSFSNIERRDVIGAVLILLITYAMSNISFVFENTPFSTNYSSEIFIMRTLADMGGLAVLTIYHLLLIEMNARMEAEMDQQILQMQYSNYQASEESIDLINRKYHDLKHQIAALRYELGDSERYFYLTQMENEIRAFEAQNKTGNKVLDIMLTSKGLVCQNQDITMNVVADGSQLDFMNPMDLSSLFGNALDNAIRSTSKLENPEERLIKVVVCRKKQFVSVRIENRCSEPVRFDGKDIITTKNNKDYHGYGVKSIRKIAEKYDGSLSMKIEDGWFLLSILFNNDTVCE